MAKQQLLVLTAMDNVDHNETPDNRNDVVEEPMNDLDEKLIKETIMKVLANQRNKLDSGCVTIFNLTLRTSAESN